MVWPVKELAQWKPHLARCGCAASPATPRNQAAGRPFLVLALRLLGSGGMPADPLPAGREHKAKSTARQALLFVVSRNALDHYERFKGIFADAAGVTVVLDRRWGKRRKTPDARNPERRRVDRRSRPGIDERLGWQGWAMVRLELTVDTKTRK